jgi:hypothetical protein
VRPAGGLTPTPNRDAVRDAQREAAALAASAAATSPTPAPTREAPRATVAQPSKEREPATQTASIEKTGDSYMIILASVETEAEARAQLQQIHKKYSAALGAKKLGYTRVKSGNDYVWRVRSTGLSEDEAEEICEKIETAGGKCTARSN